MRKLISSSVLCLSVLLCLGGCSGDRRTAFTGAWPEGIERVWVGPDYFANRLADWRIRGGRVECVESRPGYPLRTLHLLTRSLGARRGSFTVGVRTGPIDTENEPSADSWVGFLIGGGGEHVDYRLTAMTHHKPAEDGGLLAVVDGSGTPAFRDNSAPYTAGGQWSISGPVDSSEVPVFKPGLIIVREDPYVPGRPVVLELSGVPDGESYSLTLTAVDEGSGELVCRAQIGGVPRGSVEGGIALVSHLGPVGSPVGFWFRDWRISGSKVTRHDERTFGPVLGTQYTLSRGVLKLTAQMPPLGSGDTRSVGLQIPGDGGDSWETIAEADWVEDSYTATFRVDGWDGASDVPCRVRYDLRTGENSTVTYLYGGTIRAEPAGDEFVVAAFTGNKNYTGGLKWNHHGIWFPHVEVIEAVEFHDPDFLFFSGDQVYEGDFTPAITSPFDDSMLDYLYKWYRWYWAFRDLTRDRPSVSIPDDHDVYHGNIWGAGGRKAEATAGLTAQDGGGYKMSPRFVNAVHRTQTSHLPDPFDPTPVEQGISVYYSQIDYGGVSFAVVADRQWKSSPTVMVPSGGFVNGWPQNPDFDPATQADVPGAVLLGRRQLDFLRRWAEDWSHGAWMKVFLSQTVFSNVATIPADATSGSVLPTVPILPRDVYPRDYKLAADGDSNGWPPGGRNRALREMRRAFALHIAGDQHLGSTIQYGVDEWRDAGFALCVPSVGNTWPRRWFPPRPGLNRRPGSPEYTGDFLDGFGNRMTVHAVSNPFLTGLEPSNLYDRAPGYGIVRLNRRTRGIVIECWPRWVDPSGPGAGQYEGWPVEIHQLDNYGRQAVAYLPLIEIEGMSDPVIQVIEERIGETVYTLRIAGNSYRPKVFGGGTYTVRIGDPDTGVWQILEGLIASEEHEAVERVTFR